MRSVEELNAIIDKLNKELQLLKLYIVSLERELVDKTGIDLQEFKKKVNENNESINLHRTGNSSSFMFLSINFC